MFIQRKKYLTLNHPPLSISISSTIGIRVGSFGNLTTRRKMSREHMVGQDGFSTKRALLFDRTNYDFWSIRM
jgi:hypothetical protein